MTMRVDEALAAEVAYRREQLMPRPRSTGATRHRWLPRRSRSQG
jgi:hypothetical protein